MTWYQNGVEGSTRILNLLKVYSQNRSYTSQWSQQSTCGQHAMQDVKAMWSQCLHYDIYCCWVFYLSILKRLNQERTSPKKSFFGHCPKRRQGRQRHESFEHFFEIGILFAKVCDKGVIILCLHLKVREVREKVDSESRSCGKQLKKLYNVYGDAEGNDQLYFTLPLFIYWSIDWRQGSGFRSSYSDTRWDVLLIFSNASIYTLVYVSIHWLHLFTHWFKYLYIDWLRPGLRISKQL